VVGSDHTAIEIACNAVTHADGQRLGREPAAFLLFSIFDRKCSAQGVTCDHLSKAMRRSIRADLNSEVTMSAKTQKNWRELRRDLHNEQEAGNLMDMLSELNGALEKRVVEKAPPEGLSASAPRFDPPAQAIRSSRN
jgi:hypothetical protein